MNNINRNQTIRDSSFELLRIIAMLGILASHYTSHGLLGHINTSNLNMLIAQIIGFGNIGTSIFIMLSGYFNVKSTFR